MARPSIMRASILRNTRRLISDRSNPPHAMQQILRRTALAEAQAARRLAKKKSKYQRGVQKSQRENDLYKNKLASEDIKLERLVRREDYELGPLAPRRDVGINQDTYGTISPMRIKGKELSRKEKLELYPDTPRYANIVPEDRVVLLEGRDKGKIGKVLSVDSKTFQVTVEGLNLIDIAVPEWIQKAEETTRPVRTIEQAIPISSVRLVFPYVDPETGIKRDVIATKLLNGNIFHDRHTGRKRWKRFIPGINVTVPWPKIKPREHKDFDCDTLRVQVETRTFVPTLLRPPMPSSVIDELRNKYSKFRTRHDDEYVQAKIQEEKAKEERKSSTRMMLEPMQTIKALARLALKQEAKLKGLHVPKRPKVTAEMLGQAIARSQGLTEAPEEDSLSA